MLSFSATRSEGRSCRLWAFGDAWRGLQVGLETHSKLMCELAGRTGSWHRC